MRKWLISAFVVLNVGTVLFMNVPPRVNALAVKAMDRVLGPMMTHHVRNAGWGWAYYAYIVGLDNRWQMFGALSRFEWNCTITAIYENGKERELPSPRLVSEDSFMVDYSHCGAAPRHCRFRKQRRFLHARDGRFFLDLRARSVVTTLGSDRGCRASGRG